MSKRIIGLGVVLAAAGLGSGVQAADSVSGSGSVPLMNAEGQPADSPFAPRFAYAYASGEGDARRFRLVMTDAEPPRAAWDAAVDRDRARADWCAADSGSYIAFEMKATGEPEGMDRCGKGGMRSSSMVNTMNGLASIQVKLGVNDGKRLQGTIVTGDGACGNSGEPPKYCTDTGSFTFDVTLAIAPLMDRVWAQGKPDAPELAGARKALEAYWDAAGKAKAYADIASYVTSERRKQSEDQAKENAEFIARMFGRVFVPAHAGPLTIGEARLLGTDALLATTNPVTRREKTSTQTCRVLMRKEGDAWKVDKESCRS